MRTNPVHILQTYGHSSELLRGILADFEAEGVELTKAARQFVAERGLHYAVQSNTSSSTPGVVGLVYDRPDGPGFVTPLEAREAKEWSVAWTLPFGDPGLRTALERLLHAAGETELAGLFAELFAYEVQDSAGFAPEGTSMTIASLLAVVRAVAGDGQGLFCCACAVAEPGEGVELRPVDPKSMPAKLKAFIREYGSGSLLVRPSRCCEAEQFDSCFLTVWRVDSFADLARYLEKAGLLTAFRRQAPLNRQRFERARDRLSHRAHTLHEYQQVLALAPRLLEFPRESDVPPASVEDVRHLIGELQRHLGRYVEAVAFSSGHVQQLARHPERFSYDDQARAAANLAAALFDAHRFNEARDALSGWYSRLTADPALVSPLARVMVFNTLGRVEAILGGDWEGKFRASLALQRATHPPEQARTLGYLIHALLRHDRLPEAERAIRQAQACRGANLFSQWVLGFASADLARRRGKQGWSDPAMDGTTPAPGSAGHPFGLYFQTTARQAGRSRDECAERLHRAAEFFEVDVVGAKGLNLVSFLAACVRLRAAAAADNGEAWRALRVELGSYLRGRHNQGFARYYRGTWGSLGDVPSVTRAEALLDRVPYF